jgi:hypothetical protein
MRLAQAHARIPRRGRWRNPGHSGNGHHERPFPAAGHQLIAAMTGHEMTEPEAPACELVILPAEDITLPEVLRHIEAGRIVLVIPCTCALR